jgi:hypothetical protein
MINSKFSGRYHLCGRTCPEYICIDRKKIHGNEEASHASANCKGNKKSWDLSAAAGWTCCLSLSELPSQHPKSFRSPGSGFHDDVSLRPLQRPHQSGFGSLQANSSVIYSPMIDSLNCIWGQSQPRAILPDKIAEDKDRIVHKCQERYLHDIARAPLKLSVGL